MSTIAKTISAAQNSQGEYRAGGTDVMDRHRHHVSTGEVVDISGIPNLSEIAKATDGSHSIGALVTVDALAHSMLIQKHYPGLAMAAGALANPQIRRAASVGGSLLQRNRCWYYRHEDIACFKKGGNSCPMREGNHQFGVCFDLGPCVSPHPSTLGMVLLAYDAQIEIADKGLRNIADLYGDGKDAKHDHTLAEGELLTQIHLPDVRKDEWAFYFRSISRAHAEWPLVEAFARGYKGEGGVMEQVRVSVGGVANIPLRLPKVEAFLNGKIPSAEVYKEAGRIAAVGALPLPGTQYKVELLSATLEETLRNAFGGLEIRPKGD